MAIDIGLIAYNKYRDELIKGHKDILPEWSDLGKVSQDAWRSAAVAVLQYIDEQERIMKENPDLVG